MKKKLVIIGNGMAAGRTLDNLFATAPGHFDVTLLGAEPRVNYDRIMLSPVLSGEKTFEDIIINFGDWYEANDVDLRRGDPVIAIDCERKLVTSARGLSLDYDTLSIASG